MQNNYLVTFNRARCLLEVFRRLGKELGGCSKSGIPGLSAPLQLAIIRAQALPSPDGDTFEGGLRPQVARRSMRSVTLCLREAAWPAS